MPLETWERTHVRSEHRTSAPEDDSQDHGHDDVGDGQRDEGAKRPDLRHGEDVVKEQRSDATHAVRKVVGCHHPDTMSARAM